MIEALSQIQVTRLSLLLRPVAPWRLPPYLGVTVRGALGAALRRQHCDHPTLACAACPRVGDCVVPGWFDPGLRGAGHPPGFAIHAEAPDEWAGPDSPIRLTLTLFDEALEAEHLRAALQAMAEEGLGGERVPHTLEAPRVEAAVLRALPVDDPWRFPPPAPLPALFQPAPEAPRGVIVRLRSPWAWSRDVPRGAAPSAGTLLHSALSRVNSLRAARGDRLRLSLPEEAAGLRLVDHAVEWTTGNRYSRRQEEPVHLEGLTGWHLAGPPGPWIPLLQAAEVCHIGRRSSHGLGVIELHWR